MLINDITDRYHQCILCLKTIFTILKRQIFKPRYSSSFMRYHKNLILMLRLISDKHTDYPTTTLITNYEYEQKLQDDKRK